MIKRIFSSKLQPIIRDQEIYLHNLSACFAVLRREDFWRAIWQTKQQRKHSQPQQQHIIPVTLDYTSQPCQIMPNTKLMMKNTRGGRINSKDKTKSHPNMQSQQSEENYHHFTSRMNDYRVDNTWIQMDWSSQRVTGFMWMEHFPFVHWMKLWAPSRICFD